MACDRIDGQKVCTVRVGHGRSTPLWRKDDLGQVDDRHEAAWRRVSPREEEGHVPMANKGKRNGSQEERLQEELSK